MERSEAVALTERFLQELESCRFITSEQLYADRNAEIGGQRFPKLMDIPEEKIRMLVLRGWLHGDTAGGPNPNAKIHGGSNYVILGPGPLWTAYEQGQLTIEIANRANTKAALAIGVSIGGLIATAIWYFYSLQNGACTPVLGMKIILNSYATQSITDLTAVSVGFAF